MNLWLYAWLIVWHIAFAFLLTKTFNLFGNLSNNDEVLLFVIFASIFTLVALLNIAIQELDRKGYLHGKKIFGPFKF